MKYAYSICDSIIEQIPLKMPEAVVGVMSSLFVPGEIFRHRQSNVGSVAENHQRVKQLL